MADCSASGTTLDRVARAMGSGVAAGGQQEAAAKHMASLMGHAAVAGPSLMPASVPEHLVLPAESASVAAVTLPAPQRVVRPAAAPAPSSVHVVATAHAPLHQQPVSAPHFFHPQRPMTGGMHTGQQMQMQMQMMFHAQRQQQQLMQQQIMAHQHREELTRRREIQRQRQLSASNQQKQDGSNLSDDRAGILDGAMTEEQIRDELRRRVEDLRGDDAVTTIGHEGMVQGATIEELAAAWAEVEAEAAATTTTAATASTTDDAVGAEGHEGVVQGATIEELAAAWAEAEDDFSQVEAATNLWSGGSDLLEGEQRGPPRYDFLHRDLPKQDAQSQKRDWMEEGMRHFRAGDLGAAVRAFETELQLGDPDNASAWRMLGRCHAENDQDREAIVCLEHAVDRDPYSPDALLALGVSYVNELNHERALASLKAWITHNPGLAGSLEAGEDDVYGESGGATESPFDEVQRLLLRALEFQTAAHNRGDSSSSPADVLEALGVVYNVSRDYEAAVDSFERAIQARPGDYQLWNKLGATLANSNRSDEALRAYHEALRLKPKYARAWLNMAISHSNLHNYDEAARCYLQTLSLNRSALHCWSYLRIALSCSERWELIPFAASQDLEALREHFDFVIYEDANKAASELVPPN